MTERGKAGKVARTGSATAYGGVANSGIHYGDINVPPAPPVRTRYLAQVERIAPPLLEDREAELAELTEFCTSPATAGMYAWWRAPAWSGKSALMSWFVLHPPRAVRIVSFFVTARLAGQNDRGAFVDNVLEQLLTMMGEALPPFLTESTRDAHLLGLLAEAAEACRERGEEFVLLVDGLDEDRGAGSGPDAHSIAGMLPADLPSGMRVVVAGRPNPPIPGEVPAHHPLREESVVRQLPPSPRAQAVREEMERDLLRLLEGTAHEQDLLGLVTAAGGGLSAADLSELTGWPRWEVNRRLHTVTGRSFAARGSQFSPGGPDVFLLGHEQLQVTAVDMLGPVRLAGYRDRLHAWAQRYRARRWPEETPEYLLRGYFRMLRGAGDVANMVRLGTDIDRQNRMLDLSGGDAVALSEIVTVLDTLAEQPEPDLLAMVRLAMHRDHLSDRNSNMPNGLPAAWARLGQFHRAESLAESIPVDFRVTALVPLAEVVAEAGHHEQAHDLLERAATATRSSRPGWQTWALTSVARAFTAAGAPRRAREVTEQAEAIALSFLDPGTRAEALAYVAVALAEAGNRSGAHDLLEQAMTATHSIGDSNERGAALDHVVEAVVEAGDCGWAETIARSITSSGWHASAMASVAAAVATAGDPQRAEAVARSLTGTEAQATALAQVAEALSTAGDPQRARGLFEETRTLAHSLGEGAPPDADRNARDHTLMFLACTGAIVGEHRWAEATALSITEPSTQSIALLNVAWAVAEAGDCEWAEKITDSIPSPDDQAKAMVSLATALTAAGDHRGASEALQRTEAIARSITAPHRQAGVLISLACAGKTDPRRAQELLQQAEKLLLPKGDPLDPAGMTLARLAKAVAATGDWQWAERIARSLAIPSMREYTLVSLTRRIAEAGDLQKAERIIRSLTDQWEQAAALGSLADIAAKAGDFEQARKMASSLTLPVQQAETWASLAGTAAKAGDQEQARECLEQAETAISSLTDPNRTAWKLIDVARAVEDMGDRQGAREVLRRAETAARSITDTEQKTWRLVQVAKSVARSGDERTARGILAQAEALVPYVPDPQDRQEALGYLVRGVLEVEDHRWAATLARTLTEPNLLEAALVAVARAVTRTGDHRQAESTVRFLTDPNRQASALLEVAKAVAEAGDHEQAERIARSIPRAFIRQWALASVAAQAVAEGGDRGRAPAVRLIADALRLGSWHETVEGIIQVAPSGIEAIAAELEVLGDARPGHLS